MDKVNFAKTKDQQWSGNENRPLTTANKIKTAW
jgi:hypothetical protein